MNKIFEKNRSYILTEPFEFNGLLPKSISLFYLKNINGDVKITGWDKNYIDIKATKKVECRSLPEVQEKIGLLKINKTLTENDFEIETYFPTRDFCQYQVDFSVNLPFEININLCLLNSSILLNDLRSSVNILNKNGNCRLTNIYGNLTMQNVNGNIDAEFNLPVKSECRLSTINGQITAKIHNNTSAYITGEVKNGFVKVKKEMEIKYSSARKIKGFINGNSGVIKLSSVNGLIYIV